MSRSCHFGMLIAAALTGCGSRSGLDGERSVAARAGDGGARVVTVTTGGAHVSSGGSSLSAGGNSIALGGKGGATAVGGKSGYAGASGQAGNNQATHGGSAGSAGSGNVAGTAGSAGASGNAGVAGSYPSYRVVQVALGLRHSAALLDNGQVKCWGANVRGALGLGDERNRGALPDEMGENLPAVDLGKGRIVRGIAAGSDRNCAWFDDGTVKCWGSRLGPLGESIGDEPGEMGDMLATVDLGQDAAVVKLALGEAHVCALLRGGRLKCWGQNHYGQLGLGDTATRGDDPGEMGDQLPFVDLGSMRIAIDLSCGTEHCCALLDDASLKCWGFNLFGALGLGDKNPRGDEPGEMGDQLPPVDLGVGRRAIHVSAGRLFTCALLDNGSVKCWGENMGGTLGLGDQLNRGIAPGQMGDNLANVDLGTGMRAKGVTAGAYLACALIEPGSVKCWGQSGVGQLGLGDMRARGSRPGEMGDNLPSVQLGTGRYATDIRVGDSQVCAQLDEGSFKCWGWNFAGQLGLGDTNNRGDEPGEMGDSLPVLEP